MPLARTLITDSATLTRCASEGFDASAVCLVPYLRCGLVWPPSQWPNPWSRPLARLCHPVNHPGQRLSSGVPGRISRPELLGAASRRGGRMNH